ncbi:glycosyltransferase family 4 protein [bacterium]|nr:glycosyltransferase family 4 protein [bacterium]
MAQNTTLVKKITPEQRVTVLFVTPHFGNVTNGPALYTQNLWSLFSQDQNIDFHIATLTSNIQHPKIHEFTGYQRSRSMYAQLERHVGDLLKEDGFSTGNVLIHLNSAHTLSRKTLERHKSIIQINDTEVAQWEPSIGCLLQHGLRRNLALAWRKKRERSAAMAAKIVVCNSQFTSQTVGKLYSLDSKNVITIYKAIALAPFQAIRPKARKTSHQLELIFIGSNWVRKGLQPLILALDQMRHHKKPYAVSLSVYGDPPHSVKSRFVKTVKKLKLTDRIHFKGVLSRDRAPEVISKHDALIIPSLEEALGLVAIEGLAVGIPVIASNVGGLPEIVNSEIGYLAVPGDHNSLANYIDLVATKSCTESDIQERKRSVARFGIKRLENELRTLYLSI